MCIKTALPVTSAATITKYEYVIDATETLFNPCTNEYMRVTGYVLLKGHSTTTGNTIIGNYDFNYSNVNAVGVTSGKVYQAVGHVAVEFKAFYDHENDIYYIPVENINNKVSFISGGNKFESIFTYHARMNEDGSYKFLKEKLEFNTCQ